MGEKMETINDKPVSKQALYQMVSRHAGAAINRLVELTKSQNDNVALGACRVLLNKTIPDIKSIEFVGDPPKVAEEISGEELEVRLVKMLEHVREMREHEKSKKEEDLHL